MRAGLLLIFSVLPDYILHREGAEIAHKDCLELSYVCIQCSRGLKTNDAVVVKDDSCSHPLPADSRELFEWIRRVLHAACVDKGRQTALEL